MLITNGNGNMLLLAPILLCHLPLTVLCDIWLVGGWIWGVFILIKIVLKKIIWFILHIPHLHVFGKYEQKNVTKEIFVDNTTK